MAMTKSGTLYVANFYGDSIDVFEGKDFDKTHRIPVCKCPRHLAMSPDDKMLYISCLNFSQLHAMDVATENVLHKVQIGTAPKSIDVSRDGRYVYSADYGEGRSVSVVDTQDWTARIFPIHAMDRASGVAVGPDGKHALVTGWYDGHVYLVGFEGTGGHPEATKKRMRRWQFIPRHPDPGD
jgi:DNA-binding beta-propeller fold protein YncE